MTKYWIKKNHYLFNIYDYPELEDIPKEKIVEFLNYVPLHFTPLRREANLSQIEGYILKAEINDEGYCIVDIHSKIGPISYIITVRNIIFHQDLENKVDDIFGIVINYGLIKI